MWQVCIACLAQRMHLRVLGVRWHVCSAERVHLNLAGIYAVLSGHRALRVASSIHPSIRPNPCISGLGAPLPLKVRKFRFSNVAHTSSATRLELAPDWPPNTRSHEPPKASAGAQGAQTKQLQVLEHAPFRPEPFLGQGISCEDKPAWQSYAISIAGSPPPPIPVECNHATQQGHFFGHNLLF